MWTKICGNTNFEDAQHAVHAGAHALGFVFAPSPRRVTAEQVRSIAQRLPDNVELYGVFVDASFDEIVSTVNAAGLTGVQLHSNPDAALPLRLREHFAAQPGRRRLGILSVLHFTEGLKAGDLKAADLDAQLASLAQNHAVDAVLIDSRTAEAVGGTGISFDWQAARSSFLRKAPHLRLIAAGGLTPDNIAEAIHTLSPWGVDVVTGVEAAPGRKDPARVSAFLRRAHEAAVLATVANKQPAARA